MGEVTPLSAARGDHISGPARLEPSHDVSKFDCGQPSLNEWLQKHALTSEGRTARTYVVCENNVTVIGYYCILTGSVARGALPGKLKRVQGLPHEIPVAILGRLARDLRYRGTKLGADLLRDAISRIVAASDTIGIRCILVQALDEKSCAFYKDYQFVETPIGSRTLFLPIETAISAL
jgi:predicted GNAT family N-acyltransferase